MRYHGAVVEERRQQDAGGAWSCLYELMLSRQNHDRMHDVCESVGLTPGLLKALMSMRSSEPRPMKDLAGEWRCDASYVTSLVDGLEERGIVERRAHPADRRAKVIALTDKGERVREEVLARMHEPPPCFDVLTAAEVRELRRLLAKVVEAATSD
jgi:DNA-binding MarR family transcriptional regulator